MHQRDQNPLAVSRSVKNGASMGKLAAFVHPWSRARLVGCPQRDPSVCSMTYGTPVRVA